MDDYLEEIVSIKFDELDYLESFDDREAAQSSAWPDDDDIDADLLAFFNE